MPPILRWVATATAALALAVVGCGGGASDGVERQAVSGTVTLDGKPLDDGQITFVPEGGGDLVAGGAIKDGRYAIARADGPAPGPHRVNVYSRKPTGRRFPSDDEPGTFIEETEEIVPDRYNFKSELRADVQSGGDNRFDFELTGAKAVSKARR